MAGVMPLEKRVSRILQLEKIMERPQQIVWRISLSFQSNISGLLFNQICDFITLQSIVMLELTCLERMAIGVLKQGKIPKHVAFIMDGNRRFAKNQKKDLLSGHVEGANTLKKCLLYCLELGIQQTSFYAFSLENFNRKSQEIEFLMELARYQFQQLSQIYEKDNIFEVVTKNNVKVVVVGDLQGKLKELYPDVRDGFAKLEERTRNNTKMTLNICFAYDSIYEINRAIDRSQTQEEFQSLSGKQKQEKIFENLLIPRHVDLLIRTSNQWRLSNFMLMQVKYAYIEIQKNFWPSFNLLLLAKILLKYNYYFKEIKVNQLIREGKKQE